MEAVPGTKRDPIEEEALHMMILMRSLIRSAEAWIELEPWDRGYENRKKALSAAVTEAKTYLNSIDGG